MATLRPGHGIDRRLTRDLNRTADELISIAGLAENLAKHLRDVQSLGFDHDHPDRENFDVDGKAFGPTMARELLARLRDKAHGVPALERQLLRHTDILRRLFVGKPAEDLRGTLLGWFDDERRFVAHSPSSELATLLKAQRRREERAPRTGETTHERLEAQASAPKVRGLDPHEQRLVEEREQRRREAKK